VVVMADIEVRVPSLDCSFLCFLWWPNGKLSCAVEEYQMTVHLFGTVSSPACSNFAVRKTAEDFSADVINRVKWNFCVDKSLCLQLGMPFLVSVSFAAYFSEVVFD